MTHVPESTVSDNGRILAMTMFRVESLSLWAIGYSAQPPVLGVVFREKGAPRPWLYLYHGVSDVTFSNIVDSESPGKTFHALVRAIHKKSLKHGLATGGEVNDDKFIASRHRDDYWTTRPHSDWLPSK